MDSLDGQDAPFFQGDLTDCLRRKTSGNEEHWQHLFLVSTKVHILILPSFVQHIARRSFSSISTDHACLLPLTLPSSETLYDEGYCAPSKDLPHFEDFRKL